MNNNSNHSTVWILGLIVVLVLGVLIGTNLKKPAQVANSVANEQQGAVANTTNTTVPVGISASVLNNYDKIKTSGGKVGSISQYLTTQGYSPAYAYAQCFGGGSGNWSVLNNGSWVVEGAVNWLSQGMYGNGTTYSNSTIVCFLWNW